MRRRKIISERVRRENRRKDKEIDKQTTTQTLYIQKTRIERKRKREKGRSDA